MQYYLVYTQVMSSCWDIEPSARLDFTTLLQQLDCLVNNLYEDTEVPLESWECRQVYWFQQKVFAINFRVIHLEALLVYVWIRQFCDPTRTQPRGQLWQHKKPVSPSVSYSLTLTIFSSTGTCGWRRCRTSPQGNRRPRRSLNKNSDFLNKHFGDQKMMI